MKMDEKEFEKWWRKEFPEFIDRQYWERSIRRMKISWLASRRTLREKIKAEEDPNPYLLSGDELRRVEEKAKRGG